MKVAIMQPYFLPYLGYWQLIDAVDCFVIYDDVFYIKNGWVNRNRILINGKPFYMTVPLEKASQNKRICELKIVSTPFWRHKLIKTIRNTYQKSPYFLETVPVIEQIIHHEANDLADYLLYQLKVLSSILEITTKIVRSSRCYKNENLKGQNRILDICKRERATIYINPEGGKALYNKERFRNADIDLKFIVTRQQTYKQSEIDFISNLSIIDMLMELGSSGTRQYLGDFDLV